MKKNKLSKKGRGVFIATLFVLMAVLSTAYAAYASFPGGNGCLINPDKEKVGRCAETTEGTYRCIVELTPWNCTGS